MLKLPDASTLQSMIDGALAKLPAAVRDRIESVTYVPQGGAWPRGTTQTIIFGDLSTGEDIRVAIQSKGFLTETIIETAMKTL